MYSYTTDLGSVICRAEMTSDGRFAAVVILVHPSEGGQDMLRHMCPGSDARPDDAAAKAQAWAEKNYPPKRARLHAA